MDKKTEDAFDDQLFCLEATFNLVEQVVDLTNNYGASLNQNSMQLRIRTINYFAEQFNYYRMMKEAVELHEEVLTQCRL